MSPLSLVGSLDLPLSMGKSPDFTRYSDNGSQLGERCLSLVVPRFRKVPCLHPPFALECIAGVAVLGGGPQLGPYRGVQTARNSGTGWELPDTHAARSPVFPGFLGLGNSGLL